MKALILPSSQISLSCHLKSVSKRASRSEQCSNALVVRGKKRFLKGKMQNVLLSVVQGFG